MFARGRSGPSKAPSTVQCQKCLKRDMSCPIPCGFQKLTYLVRHYSYECKAAPQERPYVARPSRTQQLFNPKLLPKLTNETADAIEKKKGVADELLAQKEAERARKRELEAEEEEPASPPKRRRSYSPDSVSTISTRSPSPVRADDHHRSRARPVAFRDASPQASHGRQRSVDSRDRVSHQPSVSPERALPAKDHVSRRQRSISPYGGSQRRREARTTKDAAELNRPNREFSRSRSRSTSRSRSRSPIRSPARPSSRRGNAGAGRYRDREDRPRRDDGNRPQQPPPQQQPPPPRQRSLSPFSKRLALTQTMNRGR
ncbi:hypothetical protein QBC39DRAFT_339068 [Podospora conica]|nr:hypothetical protein QBC39DRAFT_339068 [Schizothecium conicum]